MSAPMNIFADLAALGCPIAIPQQWLALARCSLTSPCESPVGMNIFAYIRITTCR
jgi:hypothetical protein